MPPKFSRNTSEDRVEARHSERVRFEAPIFLYFTTFCYVLLNAKLKFEKYLFCFSIRNLTIFREFSVHFDD